MQTLTPETFGAACGRLAAQVAASGFEPDLIVGIATGGDYVAAELQRAFGGARLLSVRSQRPSTPAKQRLSALLRLIPRPLANLLRLLEHHARILADRLRPAAAARLSSSPSPLQFTPLPLPAPAPARILIADDAVDSGKTLAAVVAATRAAYPAAEVRTAAITVTRRNPLIRPDFSLSTQLTRFPWSLDA